MTFDDFEFVFAVAAVIAFVAGLVVGGVEVHGRYTCANYARLAGAPTQWVPLDSCYITYDGQWLRWDEYTATRRHIRIED